MEDLQTKNIFYIYGNFFKTLIIWDRYLISIFKYLKIIKIAFNNK